MRQTRVRVCGDYLLQPVDGVSAFEELEIEPFKAVLKGA